MNKPSGSRRNFIISIFLLLILIAIAGYLLGLSRGRGNLDQAVATAQAAQFLAVLADTPTTADTPTVTSTPTVTATPLPSNTPPPTATSTPTPSSPDEWLAQYQALVLGGLNALGELEFSATRAQSILQRAAQEQGLGYSTVSYHLLSEVPWAALSIPRNPAGQSLPTLFWQDSNDRNYYRAQSLLTLLDISSNYNTLLTGVQFGILRRDDFGASSILLIERPGLQPILNAYVLAQPDPASDFVLDWRSSDDPQWLMMADSAKIELTDDENTLLPDIVIDARVPMEGHLRSLVNPPAVFVEQPPFAIQWINSRWSFAPLQDAPVAGQRVVRGYRLNGAALRSTPLTTLGQIIQLARQQDLNEALNYATRLDVVQRAFGLGLGDPAVWLASYLDDQSQPVSEGTVTPLLRLFDNANRERTFDAYFELDANGFYRLAAIVASEAYQSDLITPAPLPPAFTPTGEAVSEGETNSATSSQAGAGTDAASVLGLPTATDTAEGGVDSNETNVSATQTSSGTPETRTSTPIPSPTSTPSEVPTTTETSTVTETPTETATFTPTPSPTPTDTETATDTATPPLPLPTIFADEPAPAQGLLSLLATANLRGGPGVGFVSLAPVEDQTTVGVFGITESGEWYLIRIEQPGNPVNGLVGWIFRDLLFITSSQSPLTIYRDDGTSLTPTPPTATPVPGTPTPTPPPTWSATPTPLQTPILREPEAITANVSNVPAPETDEQVFVVAGDALPADPLQPVAALDSSGAQVMLAVDSADVQIWSGLLGVPGKWIPATAELLWPQTTVYAQIAPYSDASAAQNNPLRLVSRARIVGAPTPKRSELVSLESLSVAHGYGNAAALISLPSADGFSLLDRQSNRYPLWDEAVALDWLGGDDLAGVVAMAKPSATGKNSFLWLRSDGNGLSITAQPFHLIQGVAGDAYDGIWWIESSQVGFDGWQLWQFDPNANKILLRWKGTADFFAGDGAVGTNGENRQTLSPMLAGFKAARLGDGSEVTIFLDTFDRVTQQLYTGFYNVDLRISGDALAEPVATPQLLLASGSYQSLPKLSTDQTRLAFLAFDGNLSSVGGRADRIPNQVKVRSLGESAVAGGQVAFSAGSRFEFLGPELQWRNEDQLIVARSRFEAGDSRTIDRFALAVFSGSAIGANAESAGSNAFVVKGSNRILDFTVCSDEPSVLALLQDKDGTTQLLRWDGQADPQPVGALDEPLARLYLCWQSPTGTQ